MEVSIDAHAGCHEEVQYEQLYGCMEEEMESNWRKQLAEYKSLLKYIRKRRQQDTVIVLLHKSK